MRVASSSFPGAKAEEVMVVEARVEEMVEEMVGWEAVSHVVCGAYFTLKVVVELLNAHSDKM